VRDFKAGDLVAVFGGRLDRESRLVDTVSFCKVLLVGQEDLVVESEAHYSRTNHIVPKKICKLLELDPETLTTAETLQPLIGDLVVSFKPNFGAKKIETTTGILTKITYRLGKPENCEILCGTDVVNVSWPTLVVAKRN